jgi:hypothetical protein
LQVRLQPDPFSGRGSAPKLLHLLAIGVVRLRTYHAPGSSDLADELGGTMPDTELAEELLQLEEADAWFEYLESTRGQTETRYSEVEPWAWARLSQRLRAVRARRARLRPAAA